MKPSLEPQRSQGLRLHDLIGLVVGYSLAALLARSIWPRSKPLAGIPGVALAFAFGWLGLAMSGPILLLLDRRGGASPGIPSRNRRPPRPGQRMATGEPVEAPVVRGLEAPSIPGESLPRYTRAELAWMVIGGYWIALTMFVVPALSFETPWAGIGLVQVLAAFGLWLIVPQRSRTAGAAQTWTHKAAVGLLTTWPFAWIFLILLSRTI